MSEKLITLSNIELVKLFGTNNRKLEKIKTLFPQGWVQLEPIRPLEFGVRLHVEPSHQS